MYVIGSGSFIKTRWKKVFVLMLFEDKEIKFSTQKSSTSFCPSLRCKRHQLTLIFKLQHNILTYDLQFVLDEYNGRSKLKNIIIPYFHDFKHPSTTVRNACDCYESKYHQIQSNAYLSLVHLLIILLAGLYILPYINH